MTPRERWVTPLDIALLESLQRSPTLVAACRAIGIGRDRGIYRIRRLQRYTGSAVVRGERGGERPGRTTLTPWGRALLRAGVGSAARAGRRRAATASIPNRISGVWEERPAPCVRTPDGFRLLVSFRARPGARVSVAVDPESILVALRRFPSSARNVLPATIRSVESDPGGTAIVVARVGPRRYQAAVTSASVDRLALRPGRSVYLYLKATAVRRVTGG